MELIYNQLKTDFAKMIDIIQGINHIKLSCHVMMSRFKTIYDEIIHLNSSKKQFLVCLEALHFQYKLIMTEQDNLTKMLLMLLNRIYRDYYNYYNNILKELPYYEISQPNIAKQHMAHKDTEPFAEFHGEDISLVFENVCVLISSILLKYSENEHNIHQYKVRSTSGIFIGNLINTLEYDNSVLEDHTRLFLKSIDFSIKTQTAYLTKMRKRFETMVQDINDEVVLNESPWDNSTLNVDDQLVQNTDDGNPRVSQWKEVVEPEAETVVKPVVEPVVKPVVEAGPDNNTNYGIAIESGPEAEEPNVGITISEIEPDT